MLKVKVTGKDTDFECQYIRTHKKEKPSKFLKLYYFTRRKTLKLNDHREYFRIYTNLGESI